MLKQKKIIKRIKENNIDASLSHLHPVLQQVYANRSIKSKEEIEWAFKYLCSPDHIKNINKAAELLARSIQNQQKILIVGDFDADGATSTALTMRLLKQFGAK